MKRLEILPRVPGSEIPTSYHLGRCEGERLVRAERLSSPQGEPAGYDGSWRRVRGCDLAFFFRLPSGGHNADVSCPGCGLPLDVTTRRLRAGFLPLSDADVRAIKASKGQPVEVSCLGPVVASAPALGAPVAPASPAKVAKLAAAEAKLADWDAKPRCKWCLAYRAGKATDLCAHHAEAVKYYSKVADQHDQHDREWQLGNRRDLERAVERWGGVPTPCPFPREIQESDRRA